MNKRQTASSAEAKRIGMIASLNDQLRTTGSGGNVMITQNLRRVTGFDSNVLADALGNDGGFGDGNDPYGERDFGTLTLWGYDLIWKIDYYDKALKFGSEDPADPSVTHRVLTVMLASDW